MLPVYWKQKRRAWVAQENFWIGTLTIFALLSTVFVNRMSYQPRLLFSWTMCLAIVQTLLELEHLLFTCHQTPHHFFNQRPEVTATFKTYYLCHTFMEMVRVLDRSDKIIKDYWCSTFWTALIHSTQLGRECQCNVWRECGANFSKNLCMTSQDLSQWRTLLWTSADWC